MQFRDMVTNTIPRFQILIFLILIPVSVCTYVFKDFPDQFNISNCEVQIVASLLQCGSLCKQDAGVTFFFNPSTMSCRWKCLTLNTVGNLTDVWKHYGEYNISFLIKD
jgi:hypothetical protein